MSIKTQLTALAAATAFAAVTFSPLAATSAQAGGLYDGTGAQLHYARDRGRRHFKRGHRGRNFRRGHRGRHYYKRKRNRTGKYVALGVGALMLGIIASQASRNHYRSNDYYDYDY